MTQRNLPVIRYASDLRDVIEEVNPLIARAGRVVAAGSLVVLCA
jgi:hypothetical protein